MTRSTDRRSPPTPRTAIHRSDGERHDGERSDAGEESAQPTDRGHHALADEHQDERARIRADHPRRTPAAEPPRCVSRPDTRRSTHRHRRASKVFVAARRKK